MNRSLRTLALLTGLLLAAAAAAAQPDSLLSPEAPEADEAPVTLRLAWSADRAHDGDSPALALVFEIAEGYHVIADAKQLKPIEDFKPFPTRVQLVQATEGVIGEKPLYPRAKPLKAEFTAGEVMAFEGMMVVYVPLRIDSRTAPGSAALKIQVEYQACSASACLIPEKVTLETALPIVPAQEAVQAINPELFADLARARVAGGRQGVEFGLFGWSFTLDAGSRAGWLLLLLAAAGGGLLLNFTPCVLPLVPIKIIGMTAAAARRSRCLALGAATFAGVTAFWLALGAVVSTVSGFSATNQLFHYPLFTIGVGIVIALMASGMFGVFSMNLPGFVYAFDPARDTLGGSFGIGILTALLSTPCTAPFMGTAAAWAVTQNPQTTLATFGAIGMGMGAPYLLLASAPGLVGWLPKSGPASELLKQVMGLLMLAAAAYFIGIGVSTSAAGAADPPSRLYWWPVAGLCAASGAWAGYRGARLAASRTAKALWSAIAAAVMTAALLAGLRLTDTGPIPWVHYSPERLAAAFNRGKPVVLNFTAEWCLNCKALEHSVWSDPRLVAALARGDAAAIKVDLTGNNPEANAKLRETGSLTIPLLVVYTAGGSPVFKSDFYTADQVREAIEKLAAESPQR
jgi:thiol:disulfide interchange protein DsbD